MVHEEREKDVKRAVQQPLKSLLGYALDAFAQSNLTNFAFFILPSARLRRLAPANDNVDEYARLQALSEFAKINHFFATTGRDLLLVLL
jgi:hypothetical protein